MTSEQGRPMLEEPSGAGADEGLSGWEDVHPAVVRKHLVEALFDAEPHGLLLSDLAVEVGRRLGHPIAHDLAADVEALLTLGVLAREPTDDRILRATDRAKAFIRGSDVTAAG